MATFSRLFKSTPPTLPYPPLRRQFRSYPPLLWPRAVEPFHARQYGNKGGRGGGWRVKEGWSEGPSVVKREEGGGAVGRRSRLSFQCEEVEGGNSTEHVFSDVQTTEKPQPKRSLTHTYSTRCLSVVMYSVQWKDLGGKTCARIWAPLYF